MIKKYCNDWKILWWLKNIVNENGNVSSIVDEVIKTIFFFFTRKIYGHKKHKKAHINKQK